MNPFEKRFMLMLEQEDTLPPPPSETGPAGPGPVPMDEPDLGATVNAVDDVEDNPGVSWRKDQNDQQRATIKQWIAQVAQFTDFLNGTDGSSIQRQLADADCDTLFNDVSNQQAQKITRIAANLGALHQELAGFLTHADE